MVRLHLAAGHGDNIQTVLCGCEALHFKLQSIRMKSHQEGDKSSLPAAVSSPSSLGVDITGNSPGDCRTPASARMMGYSLDIESGSCQRLIICPCLGPDCDLARAGLHPDTGDPGVATMELVRGTVPRLADGNTAQNITGDRGEV